MLLGTSSGCSDQVFEPLPDPCSAPVIVAPLVPDASCSRAVPVRAVADAFSARELWRWPAEATSGGAHAPYGAPLVAPIEDSDGDGHLSSRDATAVFFVGWVAATGDERVISLDAATGGVRWISEQPAEHLVLAISDIDGDAVNDIVTFVGLYGTLALRASDGREVWISSTEQRFWTEIADLTGDGDVELVSPPFVARGPDGVVEFSLAGSELLDAPVVADLDLDGAQEILVDGVVYDAGGKPLWDALGAQRQGDTQGVPLQLDDDPEAELVWIGWDAWSVTEHDGTLLGGQDLQGHEDWLTTSAPCAGDFDGDGLPDIAFEHGGALRAQTVSGTVLWEAGLSAEEGQGACSVFDFDADGTQDVVRADGPRVSIFSGPDGEQHDVLDVPGARAGVRSASVVDLDRDGHAELLAFTDGESGGYLHAYTQAGAGWPPAGPTWTSQNFAGTNGNPGGHVPRSPVPTWLASNMWRGRVTAEPGLLGDLRVVATFCPRSGMVRAVVENRGGQGVAGVVLELRANDVGVDRVEAGWVEGGSVTDGLLLDAQGAGDLSVRVSAEDPADECDTGNNSSPVTGGPD